MPNCLVVYFSGLYLPPKLSLVSILVNSAEFLNLQIGSNLCSRRRNCINLIVRLWASQCVPCVRFLMPTLLISNILISGWARTNFWLLIMYVYMCSVSFTKNTKGKKS